MYAAELGTDWTDLSRDEVLHRAYALGVAAAMGERHPDEYDRLRATVDTSYERSMVELAYREGRQEANEFRQTASDADARTMWRTLVDGESTSLETVVDRHRPPSRFDLPPSLARTTLLDRPRADGRDRLNLPDFLRRD
ncbi:hypothetical protein SAMN04487949_1143 [Halogranum gelatinilyticum]|uniref:Uncharacterized protein n=1 Tax=Halogranum gelatinilyticum TaxID=660521 RepID=A0A1G9R2F7_9EURY|nr:hypothetical protein [Halogranum gelatinilyticum]SDM17403.1 hypothetical protein SAMN04487949_1143 [Halogranum gelatinilyticum]